MLAIVFFDLSFCADVRNLYLCEVRAPCEEKNSNDSDVTANKEKNLAVEYYMYRQLQLYKFYFCDLTQLQIEQNV